MVGRLLLVAVLVVGVLLPTAAVAADDHAVTAVSGWTPTTTDQQITGGTRAVTLVNPSDAPIDIDEFVEMLRPHYDGEIVVGEIGPVIGTHAGRGTIGIAFTA